jgi:tetratricopeptide (TPR) repeat protein
LYSAGVLAPALLALALAGPVSSDAAREAADLAHRSELEYDLGHAEEALHDLERAYLLDPRPGLLFNLGQAQRMLKHWEQAATAYRSYLRRRPDAANREEVLQLIEEMMEQAAVAPEPRPQSSAPAPRAAVPSQATPPTAAPAPARTVPPLRAEPAPAAAVEAPGETSGGSAWPWIFGATALVAAGVSTWGWIQVSSFESLRGSSSLSTPTPAGQAQSAQSSASVGEAVGIIGLVGVVGFGTGVILTW